MRLTTSYELRHPVVIAWARFVSGAWLVILAALLCSIGEWWGAALLLPAGLLFWVGRRALQSARTSPERGTLLR